MLVPLGQRLAVDSSDTRVAEIVEIASQRTGDEPAGAGNDDQVVGPSRRSMEEPIGVVIVIV
jgi:hypothetical protein